MELPEAIRTDNEFGTYELTFSRIPGGVHIERSLVWKKPIILHEEYAAFKQFYLNLLDSDRMKLALRKAEK